jgi:glucan biosynthesis protein C
MEKAAALERRNDLDWVRILAVLLLIPFHTARIFDTFEAFYVKNAELSAGLSYVVVEFLNKWQMALLFLIAGASTWYAMRSRSGGQYLLERLKRLMIPFVFGTLVIVPPQMYLALLFRGSTTASFIRYYPSFFQLRPEGMPDYTGVGFSWGHLWFILNLFVISLVALPLLLLLLKSKRGQRATGGLAAFLGRGPWILLVAVPFPFVRFLLPEIDGKPFFLYLMIFFLGFVLMTDPRYGRALERNRWTALVLAVFCTTLEYLVTLGRIQLKDPSAANIVFYLLIGFAGWFWLVAIMGLGRRYLNVDSRILPYIREAAYPFYVLHQTVIVAIGYYVVRWTVPALPKFLVVAVASLAVTIVLYDLAVRRTNVTRFLFGMKSLRRKQRRPRGKAAVARA